MALLVLQILRNEGPERFLKSHSLRAGVEISSQC